MAREEEREKEESREEESALHEPAARLPQVFLLPGQNLRDWRRLRHVMRSV